MTTVAQTRQRDPRLDFFRGLAMYIILIGHTPENWWTLWEPGRFGFSDGTEIFVFCSGVASAIAFARVFDRYGWWMGFARSLHRVWQIYWVHIIQFLIIAAGIIALQRSGLPRMFGIDTDYVRVLNLWPFFGNAAGILPHLLTLTYVPNYFDILPMYMVMLLMMPFVMLAHRLGGRVAVFVLCGGLWILSTFGYTNLPAEPWSDRAWFFNPFAWQLIFFTGFALQRGWLPHPPVEKWLVIAALAVVLASVPFTYFRLLGAFPVLNDMAVSILPLSMKTNFGILRYVHFLSLAYLAWAACGTGGYRLLQREGARVWNFFQGIIMKVGQQCLAVFASSLVIAQALSICRDLLGVTDVLWGQVVFNLLGFAAITAVAYVVSWFKSMPWKKPLQAKDTGASSGDAASSTARLRIAAE